MVHLISALVILAGICILLVLGDYISALAYKRCKRYRRYVDRMRGDNKHEHVQ